jgi:endoglucanase
MFVDVGATSAQAVDELGIAVGSPCVPSYGFERLGDDLVMGKAFDDRAGCTVAIAALDALQGAELDLTLTVAFTVSEELGLRGARTATYQIRPKVALALEGTTAVDLPGVEGPRQASRFGRGPAVTIADNSIVADRGVVTLLEELAAKEGIPSQFKTPTFGATDAGAIHITAEGVRAGVLSVPCRYIHTPLSMLRPSDLVAAVRLATAFARQAGSLVL